MNIKSSYRPVPNPINIEKAKAETATEQPAQEPKDNVQFTVHVPQNFKKRAISTGLGTIATGAAAFLLGGGIGGIAAAAAIGGTSGAVLSSDTVADAYTGFMSKRAEKKAAERLEAESANQAEQLFQAKIQATADEKFEAKWAKSGEGLVAEKVESQLSARVEAEAKPTIEAQLAKRLSEAVETGVADALKSKSDEIEQKVDQQVESKIAAHIEEKASERVNAEVEQRLDKAVAERIETEMEERAGEIDAKVQSKVEVEIADRVKAETESRLAIRNQAAAHVSDLEIHKKLAFKAGSKGFANGMEPWRDGFEIILATSSSLAESDRTLMQLALEAPEDSWITPGLNETAKSDFAFFEQATLVLQKSTESAPASSSPKAYLDAIKSSNRTWDSGRRIMKLGLKVMMKHGGLSPSEKMLCEKALVNEGMTYQAEYAHLREVLGLLSGQEI